MTKKQIERNMLLVEDLKTFRGQTGEKLREGDKFCCLGRACEVFRVATGKGRWVNEDFVISGSRAITLTPKIVYEWFGWDCSDPYIKIDGDIDKATDFNDSGRTFKTIAKGFLRMLKGKEGVK